MDYWLAPFESAIAPPPTRPMRVLRHDRSKGTVDETQGEDRHMAVLGLVYRKFVKSGVAGPLPTDQVQVGYGVRAPAGTVVILRGKAAFWDLVQAIEGDGSGSRVEMAVATDARKPSQECVQSRTGSVQDLLEMLDLDICREGSAGPWCAFSWQGTTYVPCPELPLEGKIGPNKHQQRIAVAVALLFAASSAPFSVTSRSEGVVTRMQAAFKDRRVDFKTHYRKRAWVTSLRTGQWYAASLETKQNFVLDDGSGRLKKAILPASVPPAPSREARIVMRGSGADSVLHLEMRAADQASPSLRSWSIARLLD